MCLLVLRDRDPESVRPVGTQTGVVCGFNTSLRGALGSVEKCDKEVFWGRGSDSGTSDTPPIHLRYTAKRRSNVAACYTKT